MMNNHVYLWSRRACAVLLFFIVKTGVAQPKDTLVFHAPSDLIIHLSSGLGMAPENMSDFLWNVKLLAALPILNEPNLIWFGIIPTTVPQDTGYLPASDGFLPIVVEYERDLRWSPSNLPSSTVPFVYVNAGTGPQFGNHSNRRLFQAFMISAGIGLRDGVSSGFIGQFGVTFNNVPPTPPRMFLLLNAGIFF